MNIKLNIKKLATVVLACALPWVGFSKSKYVSITYGDGDTLEPEDTLTFMLDETPDTINGYSVMSEYLPDGIVIEWTGKKLKSPKAGKVKYSKKDGDFIATQDENPCGFKISINKKKGTIKGSFKIYVQKSEKKLKSYTMKITGYLGETLKVYNKKVGTYEASLY